LPDRLIAPARFPDTGAPVTVTLPGIVHEFPAGDRIALVIAGSDASYFQPYLNTPVTISTDSAAPGSLICRWPQAARTPRLYSQRNKGSGRLAPVPLDRRHF